MLKKLSVNNFKHIYAPALLLAMTFGVCGPIQLYLTNMSELWFSIGDIWWLCLLCGVIVFVVCSAIGLLLPASASHYYGAVLFGISLGLYIQGNFVSTDYGVLDGESIDWTQYAGTAVWNTALWVVCIAAPIICVRIRPKAGKALLTYGSPILIAIQIIAVGILGFTAKVPESDVTLTYDGAFELSQNENTIVFILDAYDSAVFSDFIDTHPEYCDTVLSDFVYYPDTVGGATKTEFALPYILTGLLYQEGESYTEYIDRGFSDTELYSALREQNYTVGLYTSNQFVSSDEKGSFINFAKDDMRVGSYPILTYYLYRFTAFRYFPHLVKEYVWMYSGDFSQAVDADVTEGASYTIDDARFYTALSEQQLSAQQEQNAFRLYHLMGAHTPYTLNIQAERISEGTSQDEQLQGVMTILEAYFSQMKALDIYDDANIIIMADHGSMNIEQNPLFLVKHGTETTEYTVSQLPVSYVNLHPTLLELIGVNTDEKSVFELTEHDNQIRYFYKKSGKNNQLFLKEYTVEGFAGDATSVQATGVEIPLYGSGATDGSSYVLGTELYFDNRATALPYMKSGFSGNEPTHTWADSDCSVLTISLEAPPSEDLVANLSLFSLIQTPQRVSVYINDVLLNHYRIDGKEFCFIIPQELIAEDGILTIRFDYWDALRRSDTIPGGDGRLLSIAFISMVIDQADRIKGEIHETPTFELPEGERVNFSSEGNSEGCLGSGWWNQEEKGRWTSDSASLALPITDGQYDFVDLQFYSYPHSGDTRVLVNGQEAAVLENNSASHTVRIPLGGFLEGNIQEITFETPGATSPKAVGSSGDARELGIFVYSMEFGTIDMSDIPQETPSLTLSEDGSIDFSASGNCETYLGSGWWNQEETGRWTSNSASLTLPITDGQYDFVDLHFYSYPHSGDTRVLVNGQEAAVLENDPDPHTVRIPLGGFLEGDIQEITFETPGATSPLAVGASTDDRALGIFVYSMQLGVDEENN